ncbi:MAG TPA: hypothetical protein VIF09_05970 [Polyangiaceae bacterium]
MQATMEAIANHQAAITQLAEVVVNLHANVRALRDVVEPMSERTVDPRVLEAGRRLRAVTLDE